MAFSCPNWVEPPYLRQNRPSLSLTTPAVVKTILTYCRRRRLVIQAGGHLGIWPAALSVKFKRVLTFEPIMENYQVCLDAIQADNVRIYPTALSNTRRGRRITPSLKRYSGSAFIKDDGDIFILTKRIDDLPLEDMVLLDAIVLDIEGHEIEALEGGAETIARQRPVIVCEDNAKSERIRGKGALFAYMSKIGYKKAARHGDDYIFLPV
jgi:FkbM family methyltransferase